MKNKKVIGIVVIAILVIVVVPMMSKSPVDVTRNYMKCAETGDVLGLIDCMHPDAAQDMAKEIGSPFALAYYSKEAADAFSEIRDIELIYENTEGDHAEVMYSFTGSTCAGEYEGKWTYVLEKLSGEWYISKILYD